jgi:hypothetical protein
MLKFISCSSTLAASSVVLIHNVVVKLVFSLSIQQQGRLGNALRQTLQARIVSYTHYSSSCLSLSKSLCVTSVAMGVAGDVSPGGG